MSALRRCAKCPEGDNMHPLSEFPVIRHGKAGKPQYSSYCKPCNRARMRQYKRKARNTLPENTKGSRRAPELPPMLDPETFAVVSADPLWREWLAIPPREELEVQHAYAVALQRKYRCDYRKLSHSMRDAWCNEWQARLGHVPYAVSEKGIA